MNVFFGDMLQWISYMAIIGLTSLRKLERLAFGYFNLCSARCVCLLRASATKAVALLLLFSFYLHVCMAVFMGLKHENSFKTNMHTTVSNGPKC